MLLLAHALEKQEWRSARHVINNGPAAALNPSSVTRRGHDRPTATATHRRARPPTTARRAPAPSTTTELTELNLRAVPNTTELTRLTPKCRHQLNQPLVPKQVNLNIYIASTPYAALRAPFFDLPHGPLQARVGFHPPACREPRCGAGGEDGEPRADDANRYISPTVIHVSYVHIYIYIYIHAACSHARYWYRYGFTTATDGS